PYVIPTAPPPIATYAAVGPSVRGVKNYTQINAAMAQITGVPVSTPAVFTLYNTLQQSLPATNDITAFVPSGQTAISQLADLYCSTAVNTASIQTQTFPGLVLAQSATMYFGN